MHRISSATLCAGAMLAMSITSLTHAATTISGTLFNKPTVNQFWEFLPTAKDTDNRAITFSIKNKPDWASFSSTSGALWGKAYTWDAWLVYRDIEITASDGVSSATLTFALQVIPAGVSQGTTTTISATSSTSSSTSTSSTSTSSGSTATTTGAVTLTWTPPTENTDGTALTNLAGYTIEYGNSATALSSSIKLANPGLSSYVVENLPAGTYYFAVTAYTSGGVTSAPSAIASATVP